VRSSLTVGGIEVELSTPKGPLEPALIERYGPFLGAVVDPVCSIHLEGTGVQQGEPNPPLAELVGADTAVVELTHPDFTGTFDLEGQGLLTVAENQFTIDHCFRILFGLLAPRHDALMLHSCGVLSGGVANVFAGESGAGKSTLASLAGHRPLLSDEHVLVRCTGGTWTAASTPFWGSYAKPGPARSAPLARLWSLQQAARNEVQATDTEACLRIALDNAVLPCSDPAIKSAVFDVAVDLASAVPSAELRFVPEPSVWELIDARAAVA
jgi:hypothetical protein